MTKNKDEKVALDGLRAITEYQKGKRILQTRMADLSVPQINVVKLREKLGMSQQEFSDVYKIPVNDVKNWEQGRRKPRGVTNIYLTLISVRPFLVAEELYKINKKERKL